MSASIEQEGDDQAEQDQESFGRAGNLGHQQSPVHCNAIPLLPVGGPSVPVHGILQWRRILPSTTNAAREMHT